MSKKYFKNEIKRSKRFDHVTGDDMSLLVVKKLFGRTLLS